MQYKMVKDSTNVIHETQKSTSNDVQFFNELHENSKDLHTYIEKSQKEI